MSSQIIQKKLDFYDCSTELEEEHAIREITQEVILASLGRTDFFQYAQFQGGTCLRIFHGLNRFSEDLDFLLKEPNHDFELGGYLHSVVQELRAYGYDLVVQKAFPKDDSLGKILRLHFRSNSEKRRKISVKLEVDTNPPLGSHSETRYLDFPFVSLVTTQDMPSLFAGKIHALLCRKYMKGRDWYDFLFYSSLRTPINYTFLTSALYQSGPWKGQAMVVDRSWLIEAITQRIDRIDWTLYAEDVARFIKSNEQASLKLWSSDLFLDQLRKIGGSDITS